MFTENHIKQFERFDAILSDHGFEVQEPLENDNKFVVSFLFGDQGIELTFLRQEPNVVYWATGTVTRTGNLNTDVSGCDDYRDFGDVLTEMLETEEEDVA